MAMLNLVGQSVSFLVLTENRVRRGDLGHDRKCTSAAQRGVGAAESGGAIADQRFSAGQSRFSLGVVLQV